ncbi:hypothetical protein TFKS16_0892 [Tannerella forsythia KS16]|nr:hypothetical protein TFKS16_0892 [Tannerella forsythia KS16]
MWVSFGIKDALDVLLVAFFTYQIYKLMKSSGTLTVFSGIVSVVIVWILVSQVLEMRLMGAILDKFISVGFLVLVILFQDDIRRFLVALGSNRGWKFLAKIFSRKDTQTEEQQKYIAPVVLACMNLARKKTGALIVIQREMDLSAYIHTGEIFTADVNTRLIENIFFQEQPAARWRHDYRRRENQGGRLYPSRRTELEAIERDGASPSFRRRDVERNGCHCDYCFRRAGNHIGSA